MIKTHHVYFSNSASLFSVVLRFLYDFSYVLVLYTDFFGIFLHIINHHLTSIFV